MVHVARRNARSWEIRRNAFGYSARRRSSFSVCTRSRWFVGSSRSKQVGLAQEDAGDFEAGALAAGERARHALQVVVRESHFGSERFGARFERVPAELLEAMLQPPVLEDRGLGRISLFHAVVNGGQLALEPQDLGKRGQEEIVDGDVARELLRLAQIAHVDAAPNAALALLDGQRPGDQAEKRRLSVPVRPHDTDALSGIHLEGKVVDEHLGGIAEGHARKGDQQDEASRGRDTTRE